MTSTSCLNPFKLTSWIYFRSIARKMQNNLQCYYICLSCQANTIMCSAISAQLETEIQKRLAIEQTTFYWTKLRVYKTVNCNIAQRRRISFFSVNIDCSMERSEFNRTTLRESEDDPSSLTGQPHSASQLIHSWFVCPLQRNGPTADSYKRLEYDLGHSGIWPEDAVNYL